jgi:hypothetical protein
VVKGEVEYMFLSPLYSETYPIFAFPLFLLLLLLLWIFPQINLITHFPLTLHPAAFLKLQLPLSPLQPLSIIVVKLLLLPTMFQVIN